MTYNRECAVCGSKYYVCRKCVDIKAWKNICCSRECYKNLTEKKMKEEPKIIQNHETKIPIILRAGLKNGKTIDIVGYDLELGKFDCSDGATKEFESFEYFIVPKDEMSVISERINGLIEEIAKKNNTSYGTRNRRSNS